ncbi:MAG: transcription antitermination factor NusB [Chloroflexota bacterium]|nr:MAG: transcription antitermination factor NusB [Chloroflexota bacterium]
MKARHQARIVALQALYEIDCTHHAPAVVLEQRLTEVRLPKAYAAFSRHLVNGVLKYQPVLDTFIHRHAPEWPLEQMAYIDRNILRMAIFEFAVDGHTPVKVAINEAVELAKTFGSDSAPRFVNGVLGALVEHKEAIAQAVRAAEKEKRWTF